MFVAICALILAFHAIVCQESELAPIKLDKINHLVGVKATNISGDIAIDKGLFVVRENNEIELFVENFGNRTGGHLGFLTKIKDRLEFRVRQHGQSDCRLQNVSKHCTVTKHAATEISAEYYVECRQTVNNSEMNLWSTNWRIRHNDSDRYQIEKWGEEDYYPIYAILHFEYNEIKLSKNCSYSIVFNSQLGVNAQNISREGNRDYVLLAKRVSIKNTEHREEWFTTRKPQPSSRTHWPYGLWPMKKQRWTFPKELSLVEFMKDKEE